MWHASQLRYTNATKEQQRYSSLSTALSVLSGNLLQAVQLFVGAYLVTHGSFTLGGMSLFQGILGSMINSLNNCISSANQLQTMRTGIERLIDIEERESQAPIPLNPEGAHSKLRGQAIHG